MDNDLNEIIPPLKLEKLNPIDEIKSKLFEHYKIHGNLNDFIQMLGSEKEASLLNEWAEEFFNIINNEKKLNLSRKNDFLSDDDNENQFKYDEKSTQKRSYGGVPSYKSVKKAFRRAITSYQSPNIVRGNASHEQFKALLNSLDDNEGELDFQDGNDVDTPKEFESKDDYNMASIGENFNMFYKNINFNKNSTDMNNQFMVLLSFLRLKKSTHYEINPYNVEHDVKNLLYFSENENNNNLVENFINQHLNKKGN